MKQQSRLGRFLALAAGIGMGVLLLFFLSFMLGGPEQKSSAVALPYQLSSHPKPSAELALALQSVDEDARREAASAPSLEQEAPVPKIASVHEAFWYNQRLLVAATEPRLHRALHEPAASAARFSTEQLALLGIRDLDLFDLSADRNLQDELVRFWERSEPEILWNECFSVALSAEQYFHPQELWRKNCDSLRFLLRRDAIRDRIAPWIEQQFAAFNPQRHGENRDMSKLLAPLSIAALVDHQHVPTLVSVLEYPWLNAADVRIAVLNVASTLSWNELQPMLTQLFSNEQNPNLQLAAVQAAGMRAAEEQKKAPGMRGEPHGATLVELFGHTCSNPGWVGAAARELLASQGEESGVVFLLSLLGSLDPEEDPIIIREIATTLAIKGKLETGYVLSLMEDPSLRGIALRCLGHLGQHQPKEVYPLLVQIAGDPKEWDPQERAQAVRFLALCGDPSQLGDLESLARFDGEPLVRRTAVESIAMMPGDQSQQLQPIATDPGAPKEIREAAFQGLMADLSDEKIPGAINLMRADPDSEIRDQGLLMLGALASVLRDDTEPESLAVVEEWDRTKQQLPSSILRYAGHEELAGTAVGDQMVELFSGTVANRVEQELGNTLAMMRDPVWQQRWRSLGQVFGEGSAPRSPLEQELTRNVTLYNRVIDLANRKKPDAEEVVWK